MCAASLPMAAGSSGKCKPASGPSIASQPQGESVVVGGSAGFGVSASGTAPFGYQWNFNGATLDGATNVDPLGVIGGPFPDPDATQEFQVVTGTYGSRYVSAPGGAVNIVTRAGSNQFHGTVFEFIRNGYFNAENAILAQPDASSNDHLVRIFNCGGSTIPVDVLRGFHRRFGVWLREVWGMSELHGMVSIHE